MPERRYESATAELHDAGGTAARSGAATLAPHIIGTPGADRSTARPAQDLPMATAPGTRTEPARKACVEAWRVPLGVCVETRDVSVVRT
ncbi:hypothetical protein [Streptomyces sp. NPDC053367]|uniref:hypothetical protein n=1 Tax=Streptomyces sp. NPDC053367 TaxID=3365700 RepID=UPI0037D5BD0C